MTKKITLGSFFSELDAALLQSTGMGLADLAKEAVSAMVKKGQPDDVIAACRLLGVNSDAHQDVIQAARRVLLKQVQGGEASLGGDEARAKAINQAADLLIRTSSSRSSS